MRTWIKLTLLGAISLSSFACVRAPLKTRDQALRSIRYTDFTDDLDRAGLAGALKETIRQLLKRPDDQMQFQDLVLSQAEYADFLGALVESLDQPDGGQSFKALLNEKFEVYEVYGNDKGWSHVFITSYYSPYYQARKKPTEEYSAPVYKRPADLVKMPLRQFAEVFPQLNENGFTDLLRDGYLRGRLTKGLSGDELFVPYASRADIRKWGRNKKAEVLFYMNPLDLFFLQIQGSGVIELKSGEKLNVVYSEQNGHPYYPLGKDLLDIISKEDMSLQSIRAHLESLSPEDQNKLLDRNPSYVFFDISKKKSLTSFGVPAQAGRSIAVDNRHFPKGALAYLKYPKIDGKGSSGRFVLDHDTGGAIRGPGRVDLYWGEGKWAEEVSGRMKGPGRLYYFAPRPDALHQAK